MTYVMLCMLCMCTHIYLVCALISVIIIINISRFVFVISRFVFAIIANIIIVTIIFIIIIILYQFFSSLLSRLIQCLFNIFYFYSTSFFWQRFIRHV